MLLVLTKVRLQLCASLYDIVKILKLIVYVTIHMIALLLAATDDKSNCHQHTTYTTVHRFPHRE
jgi:hypothetical protein